MCIIVDANRLGQFLADSPDEDSAPIHKWLNRRNAPGTLVYSTDGSFKKEVGREVRRKLAEYVRAGKARQIPAKRFVRHEQRLRSGGELLSNDAHILALAIESRARLLYTGDKDLMEDFTNPHLISKPKGKVYSGARNVNLLKRSACRA